MIDKDVIESRKKELIVDLDKIKSGILYDWPELGS